MAILETVKIGTGKAFVVVNKSDYKAGFPDNEALRNKVEKIEDKANAKSKKETTEKSK